MYDRHQPAGIKRSSLEAAMARQKRHHDPRQLQYQGTRG